MTAPSIQAVNGTGVRVLLVDDDAFHRGALKDLLETLGFDIVGEASGGSEALATTLQTTPQVVLMDLRMPGMGGIECTHLIKEQLPAVQVIILTAYDDFALRMAADEAGAYCYLPKGSSPGLITDTVLKAAAYRAA